MTPGAVQASHPLLNSALPNAHLVGTIQNQPRVPRLQCTVDEQVATREPQTPGPGNARRLLQTAFIPVADQAHRATAARHRFPVLQGFNDVWSLSCGAGRYGMENSVPSPEFPARNSVRAFPEYALQLHPATGNDSERR
jgi:hypothetical protein